MRRHTLEHSDSNRNKGHCPELWDGKAVVPTEAVVISYAEEEGISYKVISDAWSFTTYEEAEAYVASQASGDYRIGNANPFSSPVPLEELNSYELVYPGPEVTTDTTTVKIFKYLGSSES